MIDTIRIVSYNHNRNNFDPGLQASTHLSFVKRKKLSSLYFLRNLRIILSDTDLTIEGSLTKYLIGHNINFSLGSLRDLLDAFQKLSDELGLSLIELYSFKIRRIDIGRCFVLKKPVNSYKDTLISLAQHKFQVHDYTGIDFFNTMRLITFYDKEDEIKHRKNKKAKASGQKFLKILNLGKKNVLRYEIQIKRPSKHYKQELIVKDLFKKTIYHDKMLWDYSYYYHAINKGSAVEIDLEGLLPNQIESLFTVYGINAYGESRFWKQINQLKSKHPKMGKNYRNLRTRIHEYKDKYSISALQDDDLTEMIRSAVHAPISFPQKNLLIGDRIPLYDYVCDKVCQQRLKDKKLSMPDLSSFWNELNLDYTESDEILALEIYDQINRIERKIIKKEGIEKIVQDDGLTNAMYVLKNNITDKPIQVPFGDITLVDFLNILGRRCNPNKSDIPI